MQGHYLNAKRSLLGCSRQTPACLIDCLTACRKIGRRWQHFMQAWISIQNSPAIHSRDESRSHLELGRQQEGCVLCVWASCDCLSLFLCVSGWMRNILGEKSEAGGVVCVGLRQEETQREERALTIYKGQAANLNFVLLSHAVRWICSICELTIKNWHA